MDDTINDNMLANQANQDSSEQLATKKQLTGLTLEAEYSHMVDNLVQPGADILRNMTPDKMNLLHMAIGISGEVAELVAIDHDPDNELEELGDIEFYLEGYLQGLFLPEWRVAEKKVFGFPRDLVIVAGDLLDITKKYCIYNKPLSRTELFTAACQVRGTLDIMYANGNCSHSQEAVKRHNLEKLSRRYPGYKYSNEAAIARADKMEELNVNQPDIIDPNAPLAEREPAVGTSKYMTGEDTGDCTDTHAERAELDQIAADEVTDDLDCVPSETENRV